MTREKIVRTKSLARHSEVPRIALGSHSQLQFAPPINKAESPSLGDYVVQHAPPTCQGWLRPGYQRPTALLKGPPCRSDGRTSLRQSHCPGPTVAYSHRSTHHCQPPGAGMLAACTPISSTCKHLAKYLQVRVFSALLAVTSLRGCRRRSPPSPNVSPCLRI